MKLLYGREQVGYMRERHHLRAGAYGVECGAEPGFGGISVCTGSWRSKELFQSKAPLPLASLQSPAVT